MSNSASSSRLERHARGSTPYIAGVSLLPIIHLVIYLGADPELVYYAAEALFCVSSVVLAALNRRSV